MSSHTELPSRCRRSVVNTTRSCGSGGSASGRKTSSPVTPKCSNTVSPAARASSHLPCPSGALNRWPTRSRLRRPALTPCRTPMSCTSTRLIRLPCAQEDRISRNPPTRACRHPPIFVELPCAVGRMFRIAPRMDHHQVITRPALAVPRPGVVADDPGGTVRRSLPRPAGEGQPVSWAPVTTPSPVITVARRRARHRGAAVMRRGGARRAR